MPLLLPDRGRLLNLERIFAMQGRCLKGKE